MWGQQQWTWALPECIHNKWARQSDESKVQHSACVTVSSPVLRLSIFADASVAFESDTYLCHLLLPALPLLLHSLDVFLELLHTLLQLWEGQRQHPVWQLHWSGCEGRKKKNKPQSCKGDVYLVSSLCASCSPPLPPLALLSTTWKHCLVNMPLTHTVKCSDLEIISGPGKRETFCTLTSGLNEASFHDSPQLHASC